MHVCICMYTYDIYQALKAELDSRGIEWFLHYGTLLGAVRDQTIIPWTYDIDVCVPDLQQVRDLLLQMPCFYFRDHPWTEGVGKLYSRGRHLESFGSITGRSYWAEWGWIYYIGRERATVDVYRCMHRNSYREICMHRAICMHTY